MKNKKVISLVLSLSAIFGTFGAVPAKAGGSISLNANHNFIDIAHHGNTYVAMTKNSALSAAKLYTSTDGGLNWTETMTSMSATISNNKTSQQQLVYWADKNVFVAHGDSKTYTSSDGITWSENANIHWTSNTYLTTADSYLLLSGGSGDTAFNAQDNLTTKQYGTNKHSVSTTPYILRSVAAKPKDDEGNIYMYGVGQGYQYYVKMTPGSTCTWETLDSNANANSIPATVNDMVYAKGAEQFLGVSTTGKLYTAYNSKNFAQYDIKEDAQVTGIAASDTAIVAGLSDGTMYYTANTAITADTTWTEIPVEEGKTAATEPIKNIEFSDDGNSFVALSNTKVYKGDLSKYCVIEEYVPEYFTIGEPEVKPVSQDPFAGVRLIGGTYSDTLGKYIVYGDTTASDADNKYYGKIFTSSDGFNWTNTYTGYTFSKRTFNADGAVTGYTEVRNGAVWWESQGIFIVSASTQDHMGYSLTSTDGEQWSVVKGSADADDEEGTVYTGLALNADIRIAGGNLYTTNGAHKLMKYTAWNKDSAVEVADVSTMTGLPSGLKNINQIAVSDEQDPAVLMAQGYLGVVRNNETVSDTELGKWSIVRSKINDAYPNVLGIGNGDVTDAVYSKNLGKFVALVHQNLRTVIIPKTITEDEKAIQGPVVANGIVCTAIDTNDSVFMLAGKDGKIYTAPDSADFKNGFSLAKNAVPAATSDDVVTWSMTNVFKTSGDRFIATSSDNTNSAVLVIDKNTNGSYEYRRAGIDREATLAPGKTLRVSIDVDNQKPETCDLVIIAAIFTGNRMAQVVTSEPMTVGTYTNATKTFDVPVNSDIEPGSEMRIFVWNSLSAMKPLTNVSVPFK